MIGAEAEAKRIETVYKKIQEFGDLGRLIQILESVKQSPLAASLVVQLIPGLQDMFKLAFGKGSEGISREEFMQFKDIVEKAFKEKGL